MIYNSGNSNGGGMTIIPLDEAEMMSNPGKWDRDGIRSSTISINPEWLDFTKIKLLKLLLMEYLGNEWTLIDVFDLESVNQKGKDQVEHQWRNPSSDTPYYVGVNTMDNTIFCAPVDEEADDNTGWIIRGYQVLA